MKNQKRFQWKWLSVITLMCCWPLLSVGEGDIFIEDPVVRATTPPDHRISAAFMTIHNNTDEDWRLESVETAIATRAEIHETSMEGDRMQMRKVENIVIPAGESVALKPGGLHIMLMGITGQLVDGKEVELVLVFMNAAGTEIEMIQIEAFVEDIRG